MKTAIAELASQLSLIDRGSLPYASSDEEEVEVCRVAIAELHQLERVALMLRKSLEARKGEFDELLRFKREVAR